MVLRHVLKEKHDDINDNIYFLNEIQWNQWRMQYNLDKNRRLYGLFIVNSIFSNPEGYDHILQLL